MLLLSIITILMFINILLELTTNYSITGVEKNNDDAKRHYYSGNRHDAAHDILLTEARIENWHGILQLAYELKKVHKE